MKKTVVLTLIITSLLIYFLGATTVMYWTERKAQKEFITNNPKSQTTFQFSNSGIKSLKWIKPEREFEWNGKLYDIIKTKSFKGYKKITCIQDKFEKKLKEIYKGWKSKSKSKTPSYSKTLFLNFDTNKLPLKLTTNYLHTYFYSNTYELSYYFKLNKPPVFITLFR